MRYIVLSMVMDCIVERLHTKSKSEYLGAILVRLNVLEIL